MDEREYLPLSWLSQAHYCLRRAALLLNERVWIENADTAKGRAEHERVHTQRIEKRGELVKLYEYDVFSEQLGVAGKCDCIEANADPNGCIIPCVDFPVKLYPVEYKHGSVRDEEEYKIQLCAEAMSLEEMYHTIISEGALFFISSHKRLTVQFDQKLRASVVETAKRLRKVRDCFSVPLPDNGPKCSKCSLRDYCMPEVKHSAKKYCVALAEDAVKEDIE